MPDIKFHCPFCQNRLVIDVKAAGFFANCPHCKNLIQVPVVTEDAPPRVTLPSATAESEAQKKAAENIARQREQENAALKQQLENAAREQQQAKSLLQTAQGETEDLRRQLQEVKTSLTSTEQRGTLLDKEISSLTQSVENAARDMEQNEAVLQETLARLEVLQQQNQALQASLAAAQKNAGQTQDIEAERARLAEEISRVRKERDEAVQRAGQTTQLQQTINQLQAQLSSATETKAGQTQDIESEQTRLAADVSRLQKERDEAVQRAGQSAPLQQKINQLQAQLSSVAAKYEDASAQHKNLLQKTGADAAALKEAQEKANQATQNAANVRGYVADMEKKLGEELQKNKTLADELEQLQKNLASAQKDAETKRIVTWTTAPTADAPASETKSPRTTPRPRKTLLVIISSVIALAIAGGGFWLMQNRARWTPGTATETNAPATNADTTPIYTQEVVPLGSPTLVDGMRVTLEKVHVGTVQKIDALGNEQTSDKPYLVLDLSLQNTTAEQVIVLLHTWEQTRLTDDLQNILFPAFSSRFSMEQPAQSKSGVEVKPGETIHDTIIFDPPVEQATQFTLSSDPGFWRKTSDDHFTVISPTTFRVSFRREDIAAQ